MKYEETIEYLYTQLPMYQNKGSAAYKANLDNTLFLDEKFGCPHRSYATVHVAGTNGKGSVSHMLASILQSSGYKVGLYTSPHLKDFRERIRVDGEMIDEETVIAFTGDVRKWIDLIKPSFFEITVAMAFSYFQKCEVDIAIVEVGLGGRLDSTNIINPIVSVITNVGIDHTAILGNSLQEIALEKAGVIKSNVPIVVGERRSETEGIFKRVAEEKSAQLLFASELYENTFSGILSNRDQILHYRKSDHLVVRDLICGLKGEYQKKNVATVLAAIDVIKERGWEVTETSLREGLSNVVEQTGLLGRWTELSYNPLIVCDTGHNEDGVREVVAQIKNIAWKKLHIVLGMVNDKDIKKILELMPREARYYFVRANNMRSMGEQVLKNIAVSMGLNGEAYHSVGEGLKNAKKNAGCNDLIFIGGSTFVVAEVV